MYRNKRDVDKYVENLLSKLSAKEFKTRAYSIARLYFEVGDYTNCQTYVEQYLTQKDNNAAAYKLLGQALQKLGQKEKALEQYKTSLDVDPGQTSTILDICELLADDEVTIELGRAKYWCEKAEATFPRHPVTFRLRERLMAMSNPDPEAHVNLIIAELGVRPKDVSLHVRLLKHYMSVNKVKDAFEHGCSVEFREKTFINSYVWYEVLNDLLKHNSHNTSDWLFQLLLLTVKERICLLSIAETPTGSSKSLIESSELLHAYDQAIEIVTRAGASPGLGEFHANLLQHHRGQFALHAATFLLKKAKKDQLNWHDATKFASPLMLLAWQIVPLDSKVNWLKNAHEKQVTAVKRWYSEGTYRCSQAGHYLLVNIQDKNQTFLDQVSQCFSGTHWRDKLYKKIFTSKNQLDKIKTSHVTSNTYHAPILRLPRKVEVEAYDADAQRKYGNSLHHFVWILLNYKNYAQFKCTLFDMLTQTATTCGAETLNKLDIYAFLYCAALTARQQKPTGKYYSSEKPTTLPANITDLLCPLAQLKWWDCAYKFSQNELGTELTDIRATLSRGIEVVRCIDNHGLDPELLCILGNIFSEKSKMNTSVDEKTQLETRAVLYYSSAIPLLEKLKSKVSVKILEKRLFDYTHKELSTKELNILLEESKLFVAMNYLNDGEYEKVIEILSNLKSPQAYYHLSLTYKKIAFDENSSTYSNETKSKYAALLCKAKNYAYKALDILRDNDTNKNNVLYSDTQELIEDIEICMNKIDADFSNVTNDVDDNLSGSNEHLPIRTNTHIFRNISSTPKASNVNNTNYRTAMSSQILENTKVDQHYLETIEQEIKNLQKRDCTINDFMEQTKNWFEENRKLGNQIISTIHSNMQNTTDQFKLLKISVDQVKDQIDECRNECKDVGEMKKQIAQLKKEVSKLKKASSEQAIDDSDLYNLDDAYRSNDNTSTFTNQLPFTPSQVMPPFNQRLVPPFPVPPNPYQLYNQSLYNLYNQYSQFAQTSSVPGSQPIFDPTRAQMNYPGVFPTPDQMYLDVAHLVPPTVVPSASSVAPVPVVPTLPPVPTMPTVPVVTAPPPVTSVTASKITSSKDTKELPRSLPVNVVITSSDPLPTCVTAPVPVLSVTIPSKHIKGTPHNYQIPMPSTNDTKGMSPPVFAVPTQTNKITNTTASPLSNWNQASIFKTNMSLGSTSPLSSLVPKSIGGTFDTSTSVVDGVFTSSSPNSSLNKSRTLSERSNTSIENYDPCPDFKPIVPLPAEVKVTTGEEDETVIFRSRAKLFRFVDKQWKERGLGEMKLLKHKITGKVRVLMRREQIHKICANHIITAEMEIKPMKLETKAYFWVANDYADETVVLEKFCIRFKTGEIALQFYNAFEKARLECSNNQTNTSKPGNIVVSNTPKIFTGQLTAPIKDSAEKPVAAATAKAVFGGFTFSSMPTFKSVPEDVKSETKSQEPTAKVNVFSGLSFNTNTSSSFSNLFSSTVPTNITAPSNAIQTQEVSKKLNTSDTIEEFEPNVEFKPVVPLPALVEQKTGEEDETIIFEHRAKLLRFDAATKEWKERGLGNIKLLVHKDNIQKVRLLMRREQIMKVCCNHAITNEMVFQKMPNLDKAVTWCAKDFSEGELVAETFCLRFKSVQGCDDFIEAVKSVQSKMKDESKSVKEEQNAAKQNSQVGFGDQFKPKAGSWQCDTCYTNNLDNFLKCACCEQPKPDTSANVVTNNVSDGNSNKTVSSSWGDKFKPKPGSWECKDCFVRNEPNVENCSACNSPRDPTKAKTVNLISDNVPKFNFGIPKTMTTETKDVNSDSKEAKSIFDAIPSGTQFRFGIPASASNEQKPKTEATSIFDGTGTHRFSFGIPSNNSAMSPGITSFGDQKPLTSSIFGTPKLSADNQPVDFSVKKTEEPCTPEKPSSMQSDNTSSFVFKESGTFGFVFKPKTPVKGKSPIKSPKSDAGDESDDNSYSPEDCTYIPFSPVIPLPDKVEVVTGEEDEIELYGHTAKLYRFASGEWKERGKGIVKILKHKDTSKLRVVMRRDQVLKICLNHTLSPEIMYTPKDEKTWLFAANDFSEGELSLQQFCLRFKSKEIALEFKDALDKARNGKLDGAHKRDVKINDSAKDENDDVVFVSETLATLEEKQKAKELMLPENFFTYKNKEPCHGCRGCTDDDNNSASVTVDSKEKSTMDSVVSTTASESLRPSLSTTLPLKVPFSIITTQQSLMSTPVKTSTPSFQSPTNSLYGTPSNMEKTVDTSVFRTPLGAIGSNSKTITPLSTQDDSIDDTTDKENLIQKVNTVSKSVFGELLSKPATLFGGGDSQTPLSTKPTVLAPPKLSSLDKSTGNPNTAPTSIFGTVQSKSIFGEAKPSIFGNANLGQSSNKSIFQFTDKKADPEAPEVRSIFGDDSKSENLFTSSTQGSLFGLGALNNNQSKPTGSIFESTGMSAFGSLTSQNSILGSGKSIFSTSNQTPLFGNNQNTENKAVETSSNNNAETKSEEIKHDKEPGKDALFNADTNLSFATISSTGGGGFNIQKKPDFKWDGAGQQLFVTAQKPSTKASGDKSKNESIDDDTCGVAADEEYDPHYEPIVPLPDKIVVTTGEEDEEKMFGERCKLYRYDEKSREWKERGVGEMKILYHPERKTYRLLLRREQVHKAVLNMLLHMDLDLLRMKNSDRAWTWAGRNYAENPAGLQETLAVRFKSIDLADAFQEKVIKCVRALQALAAQAVRDEKENTEQEFKNVALLRLPKHLEDSARADTVMSAEVNQRAEVTGASTTTSDAPKTEIKPNGEMDKPSALTEVFKQVHFQEYEEGEHEDEEEYDHDYEGYYNEEEDESATYYSCDGEAIIRQGDNETTCSNAHIQVLFDQEIYSPKILVTDSATGEILADMLIHTETEFQMSGDTCEWTGTDYTSNDPVDKTVIVNFYDSESAMQFYDSCETSKAATYSSTDPES